MVSAPALRSFMQTKSLYIHFPFCERKCHYCDFYSLGAERTKPQDPAAFEAAVRSELALQSGLFESELKTIFFGGGTPSLTPPDSMKRILDPLWNVTKLAPNAEWTIEMNPSSVGNAGVLKEYRALGINRISMGIQSLNPGLLTLLGRVHTRETAITALTELFEAGFENVSVDFLCGVPRQTLLDLENSFSEILKFPITHLSCYLLTLSPKNPLFPQLPNEETQLEHLLWVDQFLTQQGFAHYEISNYARPGKKSQHNLAYWRGQSYLGLGPSAHSYDSEARRRLKNKSSLRAYLRHLEKQELPLDWTEELTAEQQEIETWMLALRLQEGFSVTWLDSPKRIAFAQQCRQSQLLEEHPQLSGRLRLTPRGFALSDQVIAGFI